MLSFVAASCARPRIVTALLLAGASRVIVDKNNKTALSWGKTLT